MSERPSRELIQAEFMRLFAEPGAVESHVLPGKVAEVEAELRLLLPNAYKEFLHRHGAPRMRSLEVSASPWAGAHYPALCNFFGPRDLSKSSCLSWWTPVFAHLTGLPADASVDVFRYFVPISETGGNWVCLPRCGVPNDDLPVLFFDHDLGGVHQVAPSFDEFLWWFVERLDPRRNAELRGEPIERSESVRLEFTEANDHNPDLVETCERCGGFGRLFVVRYDRPRRPDDDLPCSVCGTTGRVRRKLFDNENPPLSANVTHDGWVNCPSCGWRFATNDRNVWTGYRHRKCGQRLILQKA